MPLSTQPQMFGLLVALAALAALAHADNIICEDKETHSSGVLDGHGCKRSRSFSARNKLTVKNVTFARYRGSTSGAVNGFNGGVMFWKHGTVMSCTFLAKQETGMAGGAIYFYDQYRTDSGAAKGTVVSSTFVRNKAKFGKPIVYGGAIAFSVSGGTVQSCVFLSNEVAANSPTHSRGGAIAQATCFPEWTSCKNGLRNKDACTITMCSFVGNKNPKQNGGAVWVSRGTIASCTFESNHVANTAGAIYIVKNGQIDSCLFRSNTAYHVGGGALFSLGVTAITKCTFLSNSACPPGKPDKGNGGAVQFDTAHNQFTVVNSSFCSNKAHLDGGGIRSTSKTGASSNKNSIASCIFTANQAKVISLGQSDNTRGSGGGVSVHDSELIVGCSFFSNTAWPGGAVWMENALNTMMQCLFVDNKQVEHPDEGIEKSQGGGGRGGGAVSVETDDGSKIEFCSFFSNSAAATSGGAVYAKFSGGGGAIANRGSGQISSCLFKSCSAFRHGGALLLAATDQPDRWCPSGCDTRVIISSSTFDRNIARNTPLGHGHGRRRRQNPSHNSSVSEALPSRGPAVYISDLAGGEQVKILEFRGCKFMSNIATYGQPVWASGNETIVRMDDATHWFGDASQFQLRRLLENTEQVGWQVLPTDSAADRLIVNRLASLITGCENSTACMNFSGPCPSWHYCPTSTSPRKVIFCANNTPGTICPPNVSAPQKCTPGKYQDSPTQLLCKDCPLGTFSSAGGAGLCTGCPLGWFQSSTGKSVCVKCAPGTMTWRSGESTCEDCAASCPPGTFVSAGCNCTLCATCAKGTFASLPCASDIDRTQDRGCTRCLAGKYTDRDNSQSCNACFSGQHQPAAGQTDCKLCTAGTYSLGAATHCIACSAGMFAADAGQNKCRNCSNPRREYVLTLSGATECLPCHADATTTPDLLSCECKPGHYELGLGLDSTRRPNATQDADLCTTDLSTTGGCCLPCEKGSTCKAIPGDIDGTLEFEGRLATRPDFWRVPQEDGRAVIMSCDIPGACLGTEQLLKDVEQGRTPSNTSVSECLIGHTGIMCGSCIEKPLYRPGPNKLCIKCESVPGNGPKIAFAVAFSFFICVCVTALVLSDRLVSFIVTSREQQGRKDDVAAVSQQTKTVASRLGTLFPYLQRVVAIDDVFVSIGWPPFASAVLRVLKVVILRISTVLAFVDPCALHVDVMEQMSVALAVMPWTLIVLLGAKFGAHLVLSRRRRLSHRKQRRNERKAARFRKKKGRATTGGAAATETKSDDKKQKSGNAKAMAEQMVTVSIIAIGLLAGKLLHPCVSQQLLLVWVCSPPISGAPHGVMRNAVHVKCEMSDPLWPTLVACAVVGTILVTIGLPAVMAGMVLRDRVTSRAEKVAHAREAAEAQGQSLRQLFHVATPLERIAAKAHEKHESTIQLLELLTHQSVHWFVSKFKADMWWWFLLEMLLSLVFISLLQLASSQVWLQYYLAIVVAGIQVMLPALAKPYVEAADNTISIVGGVVYFLLVAAQIPGQFVELNGLTGVTNEVYNARLTATKSLLDATFLLSILMMLMLTLKGLLADPAEACAKGVRRLCRKATGNGSGAAKVVPAAMVGPKQRAGNRRRGRKKKKGRGQKSKTDENTEEKKGETEEVVAVLEHVREDLLASVSLELRARYRRVWREAVAVNTEVMATAIQAAVRGHQSRSGSIVHVLSQLGKASTGVAATGGDADAKARIKALLGELKAEKEREAALEEELVAERAHEAQLEEALARERKHEAELEQELEIERQHEAELVQQLEAERDRGQELEQGLSSMKLRLVGKHLEKAADEEEAKRILAEHEAEHLEHQKNLKQEQRRHSTVSKARHKRRRYKHVLDALRASVEGRSDAEIRTLVDVNGDGNVSLQELWCVLQNLTLASGHAIKETDAAAIMEEVDASGGQRLTVEEMLAFVHSR